MFHNTKSPEVKDLMEAVWDIVGNFTCNTQTSL